LLYNLLFYNNTSLVNGVQNVKSLLTFFHNTFSNSIGDNQLPGLLADILSLVNISHFLTSLVIHNDLLNLDCVFSDFPCTQYIVFHSAFSTFLTEVINFPNSLGSKEK